MKRGCIIGDSHAAALIEGWSAIGQTHVEYELDFLAFPAIALAEVELSSGTLTASDMMHEKLVALGVKRRVRLDDYDFMVVVGCGLSVMLTARALRRHWQPDVSGAKWELRDRLFRILPRLFPPTRSLISEACFRAAINEMVEATTAMGLARLLMTETRIPIMLVPAPLPSIRILEDPVDGRFLRKLHASAEGEYVCTSFYNGVERVIADTDNVFAMRHPSAVREAALFTPDVYGENALRLFNLRSIFKASEYWHANGAYGQQIFQSIFAELNTIFERS